MSKPPHSHFDTSALPREHQFAAWRDAVNARAQLKKTLPQARVDIPIQYAKPVAR